jgi:hypothetical protein
MAEFIGAVDSNPKSKARLGKDKNSLSVDFKFSEFKFLLASEKELGVILITPKVFNLEKFVSLAKNRI